jgi:hydroxypyruvate reductase
VGETDVLERLWRAALAAVGPEALVERWFVRRRFPAGVRRGLFACGKAALGMARGAPDTLFDSTLVVVPHGTPVPRGGRRRVLFAAHPEPDATSVAAARAALAFFRSFGPGDEIVALVSGGASSLLCLPRKGITLAEKRARVRRAMRAGWPIERLNRLRASLSAVKGGKLAEATEARVTTLVLSDVPGADFRIVGSGPTIRRRREDRAVLLADNRTGLEAAAAEARRMGARAAIEPKPLSGEAAEGGREFARRLEAFARRGAGPAVLLAGGETTVAIRGRAGAGGRNQEFALAAALALAGESNLSILAGGSDGVDGNSENAGARVDGGTVARARRAALEPERFLAAHDSAAFFARAGGAFRTGPTGTNVADWVIGSVASAGTGGPNAPRRA